MFIKKALKLLYTLINTRGKFREKRGRKNMGIVSTEDRSALNNSDC